jgi:lipid-binding SYLF domain-containing protein
MHEACAVLVFPRVASADFIAGGAAGAGVLLVRDAASGHWLGPAFYAIDELDIGVQVGLARRELVAVMRQCEGLAALEREGSTIRLGTSAGMQALERGPGVDVVPGVRVFSRVEGLQVGVALRATAVRADRRLSDAYYDPPLSIADALSSGRPCDEPSREIRAAVELAAK